MNDVNAPAPRFRVPERTQVVASYHALDDLIPAEHQVRLVWAVVQTLDLSAFEAPVKARAGVCGRDATPPRLLLALWLYATLDGIGSARELDRRCGESDPYRWLCGGVGVNYHTLSDFRVQHGPALDGVLTQTIAALVHKGLVDVKRITQDGFRVRAGAGTSSFRREKSLEKSLAQAQQQVAQTRALLEDPARSAELSARQKAARERAARERVQRLEAAQAVVKKLQARQEESAKNLSEKQKAKLREPRASTTDAEARNMKMPDGGCRPAFNSQVAVDTQSRAIVGIEITNEGVDYEQSEPMRDQVERRTGLEVDQHLVDGGYTTIQAVEQAAGDGVELFCPPKPPRNKEKNGDEFQPRPGDSQAIRDWRQRMGSEEGKHIYKGRASTSETVNAEFRNRRVLDRLPVRGMAKARCILLLAALAYQVGHFAEALVG